MAGVSVKVELILNLFCCFIRNFTFLLLCALVAEYRVGALNSTFSLQSTTMSLSARPSTVNPLAGPTSPRAFTPRAPFDHHQWMHRTITRREEDWRERNMLMTMQAFGRFDRKKMEVLPFKDCIQGVTAFKAGGDSFRTFKGLPPLSARDTGKTRRLLDLKRRLAPLNVKPEPAADPKWERVDHNLEMYREGNAAGGYGDNGLSYSFDGKVDEMGENEDPDAPITDKEIRQGRALLERLMQTKWKVLRQAFFSIDENHSGKIDATEFMRILMFGNLKGVIKERTLKFLMNEIDTNHNGVIGTRGPCNALLFCI